MKKESLIKSTYIFGFLLPVGETLRRGREIGYFPNYIDDFLIGAILIWAAWASKNSKWYGDSLLIVGWAVLCGGLWGSFTGQFLITNEVSGLPNWVMLLIKGFLYIAAIYFCYQSVRNAGKNH